MDDVDLQLLFSYQIFLTELRRKKVKSKSDVEQMNYFEKEILNMAAEVFKDKSK